MNIILFIIIGFIISLLFPPYFFLPLGFILFPFLCYFIDNNKKILSNINLFNLSFCLGFSFFFSFLFWLQNPFYVFDETRNFSFLFILLVILLSLIFSFVFLIILKFNKTIPTFLKVPLIFLITEFVISNLFYGFPWLTFSSIISGNEYFSFILKHFGSLVSSYIILQTFCLPYLFLVSNKKKFEIRLLFFFVIIPLAIIIFFHNNYYWKITSEKKNIEVEIFQLNNKINYEDDGYENILQDIVNNIKLSDSDLVIFGENNYPYLIDTFDLEKIQNILKSNQIVVIGGTRLENGNYFNTLLNISQNNISKFDKKILVPFGEFLPFRKFLSLFENISGQNDYTMGKKDRIIKIKNQISYIPIICYEIIFYWKLINSLNFESDFIINITNDIWFGNFLGPYQHFYLTKLRAAEFNKPIFRVSNNGISAIIDNNGKVLINTQLNKKRSFKYDFIIEKNHNFYKTHFFNNIYFLFFIIILNIIYLYRKNDQK